MRTFSYYFPISRWRLPVAGLTFLVWGLVAFSAVAWGLRWTSGAQFVQVSALDASAGPAEPDAALVARGLGARVATVAAAPDAASRLRLVGVLAGQRATQGIAVLAVDGQPAKPYRVGQTVSDGLVLQATHARQALLGPQRDGAASVTLELPRHK